jgi:hypothetical protein
LIIVLTIVEEAGHNPGATDTFVGEQGVGGEAMEDVQNKILSEAGQCVLVVRGHLHFKEPAIIIVQ